MRLEEKLTTFADYGLRPEILEDFTRIGFERPTPVQAQTIPLALEGRDVIGLAQTGTGKTAAFGLPIIARVADAMHTKALILSPTRELAQQIAEALQDMSRSSDIRIAVLVGGVPKKQDLKAIQHWPNVIVATPGRLIDHIHGRTISLEDIEILAVDEADRMYDMGFMPQVRSIIEVLPRDRQTLMFTATMPAEVEKLVRRHMVNPVRVKIGLTAPVDRAEQKLYEVQEPEKPRLLMNLLRESKGRVLVFARTKRKVERLARTVSARQRGVARLHGDREQRQRDTAMKGFRDGKYRILIATDIAARGIDVANIEHVINYDFPGSAEAYIHRIGRTARVAASGLATSFVTHSDRPCLKALERLISSKFSLTTVGSAASDPRPERDKPIASAKPGRSRHRRRRPRAQGRGHAN